MTHSLLTEEQQALDEAVGRLLAKTSPPEQVRALEAVGFDQPTWDGLVDMGLLDAASSGDASVADLAVIARQCGAHLALVPFVDTVATAGDDRWLALTASWCAGLARAVFEIGVAYVKERHQFGVSIGSFQAIQHRLADVHSAVTGSELLAHEAAVALDDADDDAPALAAMAHWWCGQVAVDAAETSLHVHGGYGFMLEYDVQLYVKRAKQARIALGDPRRRLLTIADRLWGEGRDGLQRRLEPSAEAFRQEVRSFLAEHLTDEIVERAHATGTMHDDALHRAIAARGYLAAGWPVEVGGGGRSAVETTTLMQELYSAGAPVDSMGIVSMVAATLVLLGNEEQRTQIVPRMLSGDTLACLGYSEPDRVVRAVAGWAQSTGALDDPLVAERLAEHATVMEVARLLLYRCAELAATGAVTHVEGSMAKLFVTEAFTRAAGDVRDLVPRDAPIDAFVDHAYRHSTVTTIYGGSSEIQRGIIAEHGLGLPRSR